MTFFLSPPFDIDTSFLIRLERRMVLKHLRTAFERDTPLSVFASPGNKISFKTFFSFSFEARLGLRGFAAKSLFGDVFLFILLRGICGFCGAFRSPLHFPFFLLFYFIFVTVFFFLTFFALLKSLNF